jgi:hypothetical protein
VWNSISFKARPLRLLESPWRLSYDHFSFYALWRSNLLFMPAKPQLNWDRLKYTPDASQKQAKGNQPTNQPTTQPTSQPTNQPTNQPPTQPTNRPKAQTAWLDGWMVCCQAAVESSSGTRGTAVEPEEPQWNPPLEPGDPQWNPPVGPRDPQWNPPVEPRDPPGTLPGRVTNTN